MKHEGLGSVIFKLDQIPLFTRNAFDLCHGGALTTYVDIATTCSLFAFDNKSRTHVSAKLDMDFLNPGKCGSCPVLIDARINKIGK